MHNIESNPDTNYKNQKRIVLIAVSFFALFNTVILLVVDKPPYDQIVFALGSVGFGMLILWWCKIDSEERNINLGPGFRFLLILFGIFALIAYLFKSRGFKKGLIATGYTLLFWIIVSTVNAFVAALYLIIFHKKV